MSAALAIAVMVWLGIQTRMLEGRRTRLCPSCGLRISDGGRCRCVQ